MFIPQCPDLSTYYLPAILVLLLLLSVVNGFRGYWKGIAESPESDVDDSGWENEAKWWRERWESHIDDKLAE